LVPGLKDMKNRNRLPHHLAAVIYNVTTTSITSAHPITKHKLKYVVSFPIIEKFSI